MLSNTTINLEGRDFSFNEHGVCTSDTSNVSFTEANATANPGGNNSAANPSANNNSAAPGGNTSTTPVWDSNTQSSPANGDGPNSNGPGGSNSTSTNPGGGQGNIQEGNTQGPQ